MDDLSSVEAVDGLCQSVVIAVTDTADGGLDARFRQALSIANADVSWSRTIRTAWARTSGENVFVVLLVMAPPPQELEPPTNPGRVNSRLPRAPSIPQ